MRNFTVSKNELMANLDYQTPHRGQLLNDQTITSIS